MLLKLTFNRKVRTYKLWKKWEEPQVYHAMKRTVSLHNNVVPKLRSKLRDMFKYTKNKQTIHFEASAKLLDFPSICLLKRFFSFELRTQYLRMSRKMFYDFQDRPYSLYYHYL